MSARDDDGSAEDWTPAERALLDAALDFYGAAEGVIELGGSKRPRVRRDATGLHAVRDAMAALEERIRAAHAEGLAPERIARIARIDREVVDLVLRRQETAAPESATPETATPERTER